jgi:hypothetical protein
MTTEDLKTYGTLAAVLASAFWFKWESLKLASKHEIETAEATQQRMLTNVKVDEVKQQADGIHQLVNSAMTEQKRFTAQFASRVAEITHDPKDIALADEAQKIYDLAVQNSKANTK